MGLLFKFGQAVPEIFKFLHLEKLAFFRILGGDYEGAFENWNGTKDSFFLLYSGITMQKLTYLCTPWSDFQNPLFYSKFYVQYFTRFYF